MFSECYIVVLCVYVCVCGGLCVCPSTGYSGSTHNHKDIIVLSIEFGAKMISYKHLVQKLGHFYLPQQGQLLCLDLQFMCNVP